MLHCNWLLKNGHPDPDRSGALLIDLWGASSSNDFFALDTKMDRNVNCDLVLQGCSWDFLVRGGGGGVHAS